MDEMLNRNSGGFAWALTMLMHGRNVTRKGWEHGAAWLMLVSPGETESPLSVSNRSEMPGVPTAFIAIHTADGKIMPWQPSQLDLLSWEWHKVVLFGGNKYEVLEPSKRGENC